MKENQKMLAFTASQRTITIFLGLVLLITICQLGCGKKIDNDPPDPPKIRDAKTAGLDELLGLISSYSKIDELLSTSLKLTLKRKISDKKSERWNKVSGHIYLKRPDSIRLTLRSPFGTEFDMASVGDDLSAWIPSKNRFYVGKNSSKELNSEGVTIPIRGPQIFDAVLPKILEPNFPDLRISLLEDKDSESKYYIISYDKDSGSSRIHTLRRIWIERSILAISRQQFYLEDGRMESEIKYSNMEKIDGLNLPQTIHMDRPLDGYSLTLELASKSWQINSGLEDKAFVLPIPPKAEMIHLTEKTKSEAP
jgi:outer membrane lipoprotein-sorting protein